MNPATIIEIIGFLASLTSYTALKLSGHSDPSSDQALLGLSAFFAGSRIRATLPSNEVKS